MITENSIIFFIEGTKYYGSTVQNYLKEAGFKNVIVFQNEMDCLQNMELRPEVLISDYQLNCMTGLKLFEEAKKKSSGFYSVLISGSYDRLKYNTDMPLRFIDQYIRKDGDELIKLTETLYDFMDPAYNVQFY